MTFDEFMKLPLEGRKKIEQAILDLDKAVQDEYGFSMLDTEKRLIKKVNATKPNKDSKLIDGEGLNGTPR